MNRCWNSIGVRGDRSCPELEQYIHCRNCPVYAAGALALLEGVPPSEYLETWTSQIAKPAAVTEGDAQSVVIFRVDTEWLAFQTAVVEEVARVRPIHAIPHRRRDVVLGVTNIRGELAVCVAIGRLLGIGEPTGSNPLARREECQRFLVVRAEAVRVVCPVHEVHGIHRFQRRDLRDVPATLANAATKYSTQLLPWRAHSVGLLDDRTLFGTVRRSLA